MYIKSILLLAGMSLTGCMSYEPSASLGTYHECLYEDNLRPCDHYLYMSTTIFTTSSARYNSLGSPRR